MSETIKCEKCGREVDHRGIKMHLMWCGVKKEEKEIPEPVILATAVAAEPKKPKVRVLEKELDDDLEETEDEEFEGEEETSNPMYLILPILITIIVVAYIIFGGKRE